MNENILQEADRLTGGERAQAYGSALADAQRAASILAALTGWDVRPEQWPLVMLTLKLSRLSQAPECWHRDSAVDLAGYARVAEMVHAALCPPVSREGDGEPHWTDACEPEQEDGVDPDRQRDEAYARRNGHT